MGNKLTSTVPA